MIRPVAGRDNSGRQSPGELRNGGNQMSIFGGPDPFGGSIFGGRDPFQEFGDFGAGPFDGASIMQRFMGMAGGMMPGMPGPGAMASGQWGGGGSGGSYSCQTFAMSSVMGPDGKMHTERYCSSDVGNREHGIREAQHAYSNSSTGMDKMGMERQLGDRARKTVKELDRNTMEERSTEMFRGMDESGRAAFDRDFAGKAGHMPQHQRFNPQMFQGLAFGGALGDGRPSRGARAQISDGGHAGGAPTQLQRRTRSGWCW